jgi:SpoVK/Ycf46/Vps4 family AAA+-type ATPase
MKVEECVVANELMPHPRYAGLWQSIVAEEELKDRLLHQALLDLNVRQHLPFQVTALHGLLLLYGPPGTGKTTLGRGLAQELAGVLKPGSVRLIEVNPHGLMSAEHGQSQQAVRELLAEHIPLLADDRKPTILLLDEVESMAVSRSAASLAANPADVHRATDAVLTALDDIASQHPHIITVATSNFTQALDEAFISRADCAIELPLPNADAIHAILRRVLSDFGVAYPALAKLAEGTGLKCVALSLLGCDGRRARKIVTEAMAMRRETVLDPGALTIDDLTAAARIGSNQGGPKNAAV